MQNLDILHQYEKLKTTRYIIILNIYILLSHNIKKTLNFNQKIINNISVIS